MVEGRLIGAYSGGCSTIEARRKGLERTDVGFCACFEECLKDNVGWEYREPGECEVKASTKVTFQR